MYLRWLVDCQITEIAYWAERFCGIYAENDPYTDHMKTDMYSLQIETSLTEKLLGGFWILSLGYFHERVE